MDTFYDYEVRLWEDSIKKDENGIITHHPLNGGYWIRYGEDIDSYGYLTFGGHGLAASPILDDIRVFYLEFTGEPDESYDREKWADPLRFEVLNRLTSADRCWYLSMIDGSVEKIQEAFTKMLGVELGQVGVESEKPYGYGSIPRPIFETPNKFLPQVVPYIWVTAVPGYPIEGYSMAPGQLDVLEQWNARPRDDQLFREMCDQTWISFYTFPAENIHFVFVTNKLSYSELAELINLEDLQAQAKKLGEG